jgi:hypothetical protein
MDKASKIVIIVPSCLLIVVATFLVMIVMPVSSTETLFYEGTVVNVQAVGQNSEPTVELQNGTLINVNSVANITVGHVYEFFFIVTTYRLGGKLATFSRYEEVS